MSEVDVLFYDKRNQRQVWASQLMETKVVEYLVYTDDEGEDAFKKEVIIGTLGYRTPECESYKNWDMYTKDAYLIFLRTGNPTVPGKEGRDE